MTATHTGKPSVQVHLCRKPNTYALVTLFCLQGGVSEFLMAMPNQRSSSIPSEALGQETQFSRWNLWMVLFCRNSYRDPENTFMLKYSSGVNEMYSCVDAESMAQKCQNLRASIRQIKIKRGSLLPGRWQSRNYFCEMVKERVNIRKEKKNNSVP